MSSVALHENVVTSLFESLLVISEVFLRGQLFLHIYNRRRVCDLNGLKYLREKNELKQAPELQEERSEFSLHFWRKCVRNIYMQEFGTKH